MTDRELLELAAKAAGYTSNGYGEMACGSPCLLIKDTDFTGMWAPLTDDGDALRLAVRLSIDVQHFIDSRMIEAWKHPHQACGEDYGADPYAATRRAIVRAAAEIGKGMK